MLQNARWRGYLGLAVALFITLFFDLLGAILGAPWRVVLGWQPLQPFAYLPYYWANFIGPVVLKQLLGVRTRLYQPYIPLPARPNEVTIVIGNHPPTPLLPAFCQFVLTTIARRVVFVGKIEHIRDWYAPLLGWGMWGTWSGVFIDRGDREQAFRVLGRAVRRDRSRTFVIFLDKSRPTPERIAADRLRYAAAIPDLANWQTMVPRWRGFWALLTACDRLGVPVRVVDITTWSSRPSQNVGQAGALVGATIRLDAHDLDGRDIPREPEALKEYGYALWRRKHRLMAETAKTGAV